MLISRSSMPATVVLASALLFGSQASSASASDCVFDPSVFEIPPIAEAESVSVYDWDANTMKGQGVFTDGGVFSVSYGACHHYGVRAIMLVEDPYSISPAKLRELFNRLATTLPSGEAEEVRNYLETSTELQTDGSGRIDMTTAPYSEFILEWHILPQSAVLEISFYFG